MDCLFCKIINNDIPSYKIYEDELVYAFLDINPKESGHTLIVPKKHYTDFYELDNKIINHTLEVAKELEKKLSKKLNASGMTFVWNYGISQEVKHFHLHLIPRYTEKNEIDVKKVYEILGK